jgi:transposase InsO family protein
MKSRTEFVKLAQMIRNGESPGSFGELCKRYGISRKNGYKWLKRYKNQGIEGLKDLSRKPHRQPTRSEEKTEQAVLDLREIHHCWGGRKLRRRLINKGMEDVPSASTITEILRRHDKLIDAPEAGPRKFQRFERESPNDLWQMDFKGHFALKNGGRCHPLTITDDHSRFNICLTACANETAATVQIHLIEAFRQYGLPQQILSDNGPAWSCQKRRRACSWLGGWLIRVGIDLIHGRPYHPQTQGKEERFHRTLKAEVIETRAEWDDLGQCDEAFMAWRPIYNEIRPHESLDDQVPLSRYQLSVRAFEEGSGDRDMRGNTIRRGKSSAKSTTAERSPIEGVATMWGLAYWANTWCSGL